MANRLATAAELDAVLNGPSVAQQNSMNMAQPLSLSPAMQQQVVQAQQALNQQALNKLAHWHLNGPMGVSGAQYNLTPSPVVAVAPMTVVATRKIDQLIEQLPLRALAKIARISFHTGDPMMFVVAYMDGHRCEFVDIEKFPSDSDVAKVLIELP